MFHQSRPEVPVVPSGSVVNIELDIKMVCDAYRDVVQSQLAEFILGAIGVQLELVFAQIRRVEAIACARLYPLPHVAGMLHGPLDKKIVSPHIATVNSVEYVRPQKPIERASDIVVRMTVIHLLFTPCHLILHPMLPRRVERAFQGQEGVVPEPDIQQIDSGVGLAKV
jgi:hypothetical protein